MFPSQLRCSYASFLKSKNKQERTKICGRRYIFLQQTQSTIVSNIFKRKLILSLLSEGIAWIESHGRLHTELRWCHAEGWLLLHAERWLLLHAKGRLLSKTNCRRRSNHKGGWENLMSRDEHVLIQLLVSLFLFFFFTFFMFLLNIINARSQFLSNLDEIWHDKFKEVESPSQLHS